MQPQCWVPVYRMSKKNKVLLALGLATQIAFNSSAAFAGSVWATVYHPWYHGRQTANQETFNYYGSSTAASSIYPTGARLKVSRKGRSVVVRINDNCPSCGLDLPLGAVQMLGGHADWSGFVNVQRLR